MRRKNKGEKKEGEKRKVYLLLVPVVNQKLSHRKACHKLFFSILIFVEI